MSHNLPRRRSKLAQNELAQSQDLRTIWIALASNIVIAVAKLVAGVLSGSSAMLAEAAHSFADSINEVLLGVSVHRSTKEADSSHPFGFGRARFLWAFLAAMTSFVVGGCVSIGLAVRQFTVHEIGGNQTLSWVILAIAFTADGVSLLQGFNQARTESRERKISIWNYLRRSTDPILRAVIVEDCGGVIGTILAGAGLLASHLARSSVPDAIASLLIGILLAITAVGLARPLADLLIGRSLSDETLGEIHKLFTASPVVARVIGLQATFIGPGEAVVIAKISPTRITATEFARAMDELDRQIREGFPMVADVFVDLTCFGAL